MDLPEELKEAIALETGKFDLKEILFARERLTERYKQPQTKKRGLIASDLERCAYLAARLPATYAVIYKVLQELLNRTADNVIENFLDLGSGPGTAMWAASQVFPTITIYTLVEQDPAFIAMGKRLASHSPIPSIRSAQWHLQSIEELEIKNQYDLILLSYSVGELPSSAILSLMQICWQKTHKFLVIIEPGTPAGFENIRAIRRQLVDLGAHLVAPCPHAAACPMSHGNWCHFTERIERSFLHRYLKKGALGYEDEKFSYVIASKAPYQLPEARVLRHPQKHSGHLSIELCTSTGLKQQIISKRTLEAYKRARKLEWGSAIDHGEAYD